LLCVGALVRRLSVDLVWTNTTYLESTLTMLKHYLETGIEVACDYDPSLPRVPAYAGELNQAGPTLIDNAVDAMEGMDGRGRLTVRTARTATGPGRDRRQRRRHPRGGRDPHPGALLHHQAGRQGTDLGLDICWRIVVQRHHGDLSFTSTRATASRCCCR
jgi:nitrogen-specific signal transduction histidine kinase